eukprot:3843203-Pyramimonas_sp.AAC.1
MSNVTSWAHAAFRLSNNDTTATGDTDVVFGIGAGGTSPQGKKAAGQCSIPLSTRIPELETTI